MPATAKNLPQPPSLWRTIGPSFILLGLALGSGELILWPYLAANWGLGLLWGGLLGITLQFVLNTEVMRYSLTWGESVFVGFKRLNILIPIWYIISTFIPWSLPGFSSASSAILANMFPGLSEGGVTLFLLMLTGILLSAGKTLYRTMEVFQKTIIFIGLPFMFFLAFWLSSRQDWIELAWGLVGRGDGYWFFPEGVAIASFVGAFAYSGAGGNLNLAQSYYIREKGFGMGKYMTKISSLFSGVAKKGKLEGETFPLTASNKRLWRQWWRLVLTEHFLVFWVLGFLAISILAVLAKVTVYGQGAEQGLAFLYAESAAVAARTIPFFGTFFLLVSAVTLFSTQVGVLESSSRIISENILLLFTRQGRKVNTSLWFYLALWGQIGLGAIIYFAGVKEPRFLLTLGAVLNAAAMMMSFLFLLWLNKVRLHQEFQPGWVRRGLMLIAICFFAVFLVITARDFQI
ncbi:MAG TPA: Nramp family divalent metal transporter [Patescibacteria group bacterium]